MFYIKKKHISLQIFLGKLYFKIYFKKVVKFIKKCNLIKLLAHFYKF